MYTILVFVFPFVLLVFEWGLRALISTDASSFVGPTMAAAATSFLIPLTRPKSLNVKVENQPKAVVISRNDLSFIPIVFLLVLVFIFSWASSCYWAIKYPNDMVFGQVSTHIAIGSGMYVVALVMTGIKELV